MLDRRTLLTTAAGAAAAATAGTTGALLGAAPASGAIRRGRVLARGLDIPWGMAFLPNGDALVTERETARVHRVSRTGGGRAWSARIGGVDLSSSAGEGGLLGVAVSPTFATDRRVFFYLTSDSDNRIISMRYVDGGLRDRETLLSGIPRASTPQRRPARVRTGRGALRQHRRQPGRRPGPGHRLAGRARSCG